MDETKRPRLTKKRVLEIKRELRYLGYEALGGTRTSVGDARAKELMQILQSSEWDIG